MSDNPYAPPASVVEPRSHVRLWTPNAAANWSVMFSAVFGAVLIYLNHKELGDKHRTEVAAAWCLACIGGLLTTATLRFAPLVVILVWYFGSAKPHAKAVRERFGDDYERRPWGKPILFGILGSIGWVLLLVGLESNRFTRGVGLTSGIGCMVAARIMATRAKRKQARVQEASAARVSEPAAPADAASAPPADVAQPIAATPPPPLARGVCPNCDAVIARNSTSCPSCSASFEAGSAWRVQPYHPEGDTVPCPACGLNVLRSAYACDECGVRFSVTHAACPMCHARVSRNDAECPRCHVMLDDASEWRVEPVLPENVPRPASAS